MVGIRDRREFLKKRLGALPSPWDPRHYRVPMLARGMQEVLPKEYTELLEYSPLEDFPDQGDIGSCVGWCNSIVLEITNTLLELYARKNGNSDLLRYVIHDLSAGWVYHWSRVYAGIPEHEEGSTNLGAMKAMNKKGVALEKDVPTDRKAPWDGIHYRQEDEERAKAFAIDSYWNINPNPNDMKAAIWGILHEPPYEMPDGSRGKIPLVTAYPVYDSFRKAFENGIVPMPKKGEVLLGGHSSAIVGWKEIDGKEYWINLNSWGKDVGDDGLFYLPMDYPFYSGDVWIVHNGPPSQKPEPFVSQCRVGRAAARAMSMVPKALGRRGRFEYVNF